METMGCVCVLYISLCLLHARTHARARARAFASHTSEAMSSRPRHCRSFSLVSSCHISGSSCARLSWPVQGCSCCSRLREADWECCPLHVLPAAAAAAGERWHTGWHGRDKRFKRMTPNKYNAVNAWPFCVFCSSVN